MAEVGRPSKYKEEYCQQLLDMFDIEPTKTITETYTYKDGTTKDKEVEVACDLPTIVDFAKNIGVNKDTLYEWAKVHPEFSDTLKKASELQENIWNKNALKGLYNPTFAIFMGKNVYGWKDKSEVDNNVNAKININEEDKKLLDNLTERLK